ncbi:MAG: glycosyltransferase [Phenylobacterium sp.]|nr:MAG: glycosyltransferase [Phenylobacterium sp.]
MNAATLKPPKVAASLVTLPPPPAGRAGWPWTEASPPIAPTRGDGSAWPRVSIVTPSFNQGRFLEETIRSILLQGYPELEYLVIDGGSTDETLEVIRKYEPWIDHWISEKDDGQADAINKGLARCTGEIFQFINSDDYLAPGAIAAVAEAMAGHDVVAGVAVDFYPDGALTPLASRGLRPANFVTRPPDYLYHQPGVWNRTELTKALGGFDVRWRYKFDWVFQIRYCERWTRVRYIDDVLVYFRMHEASKTGSEGQRFWEEELLARDVLCHTAIDRPLRAALRRFVTRRHWRARVDELLSFAILSPRKAAADLGFEALQAPLGRIDRYSLGALRRLLMQCLATRR